MSPLVKISTDIALSIGAISLSLLIVLVVVGVAYAMWTDFRDG